VAGVAREHLLDLGAQPQHLARLDLEVRGGALGPAGRLVQQHPRVLQREPLARRPRREQDRRRRRRLPHAERLDLRLHELHRVVDGHERGQRAAG
jgi:hypothetical protein